VIAAVAAVILRRNWVGGAARLGEQTNGLGSVKRLGD
jgi:hypothetical protein